MSATVLVIGLGDLGGRILELLACETGIGRLVGAGRDAARGEAACGQAALVSELRGGPREVVFERLDLDDEDGAAETLARIAPDLVVTTAAGYAWWRPDDPALNALPYAAWLPLLVVPVRRLMRARRAAGLAAPVICLPYPDAVGPVLAPAGLAPELGAGNVIEVAAKLSLLAARAARVDREEVAVRLVLHHAAERVAFGAFASLGGGAPAEHDAEPPWHAEVRVRGERLEPARVGELLRAPYALQPGRGSQQLTAAAAALTVRARLGDRPTTLHVPAPHGRPGGYPVSVDASGVTLDLPADLDEAGAVALNARAGAWDGIERIEGDGTVVLTPSASAALGAVLGDKVVAICPEDHESLAVRLSALLARA